MDTLEALTNHRAYAEQARSLRSPVAGRAVAVFRASEHDQRHLLLLVLHRRVVDRHLLAVGPMPGQSAFRNISVGALQNEVLDADVGEGATHHHFVIAAPRSV